LDTFVRECKNKGVSKIIGYYYKTKKNSMVSNLYRNLGFSLLEQDKEDTVWELNIINYKNKNKLIGIVND